MCLPNPSQKEHVMQNLMKKNDKRYKFRIFAIFFFNFSVSQLPLKRRYCKPSASRVYILCRGPSQRPMIACASERAEMDDTRFHEPLLPLRPCSNSSSSIRSLCVFFSCAYPWFEDTVTTREKEIPRSKSNGTRETVAPMRLRIAFIL